MKFLIAFLLCTHLVMAEEANLELATSKLPSKIELTATTGDTATLNKENEKSTALSSAVQAGNEKTVAKKESEIPLNLEAKKTAAANESPFFKFILVVGILGTLLAGSWILLKKYNTKNISKNHNEIKILAQHYLGPKKSLAVVRVAGESILVGITDNNINMIKSLSLLDEELPEVTPNDFSKLITKEDDFGASQVKDQVQMKGKSLTDKHSSSTYSRAAVKTSAKVAVAEQAESEDDEFSIKGIKDIVSNKLKNMRSI